MAANKLVSIVLPVYNGELFLKNSIESILNQSFSNLELIVVNDGSTDNSANIINHYRKLDNRIISIINSENKNLPTSLNIGHQRANGDFITWTSHDNIYKSKAIETLLLGFENNPLADIIFSNFERIDSNGTLISQIRPSNIRNLIFHNCVGPFFLYKKNVYTKNDGYKENLFLVEDFDFWLRASFNSRFFYLKNEPLYQYRETTASLSYKIQNKLEDKNHLWKANILKCLNSIIESNFEIKKINSISNLLFKIHTNEEIKSNEIKFNEIIIFANELELKNINFSHKDNTIKLFFQKILNNISSNKSYLRRLPIKAKIKIYLGLFKLKQRQEKTFCF